MKCNSCGANIKNNSDECIYCGTQIDSIKEQPKKIIVKVIGNNNDIKFSKGDGLENNKNIVGNNKDLKIKTNYKVDLICIGNNNDFYFKNGVVYEYNDKGNNNDIHD